MKLKVTKNLSNGVFKVDMEYDQYEMLEENLMEDFGIPQIKIPVSKYGATLKEEGDEGNKTIKIEKIEKDKDGTCNIAIAKEIVLPLDPKFKTSFEVKVTDIEDTEKKEPVSTVVKVAQAKCDIFVELIKTEAKKQMDELRAMKTDFEAAVNTPSFVRV